MMASSMCNLPNELLQSIINYITDHKTLCTLARISKRYQELAESALYQSVQIHTTKTSLAVREALQRRPARATFIRKLNLYPQYSKTVFSDLGNHMLYIFSQCENLSELAIESPTCNSHQTRFSYEATGNGPWVREEPRILTGLKSSYHRLTKLTLHLDRPDSRQWNPNKTRSVQYNWVALMASPILTDLTVSCALIHDEIAVGVEPKSTALRVLELVECNVTMDGLRRMLTGPTALRKFCLGENAFHGHQGYDMLPGQRYNGLYPRDPDAFIQALQLQNQSLEQFEYVTSGDNPGTSLPTETFESFTCLREVRLTEQLRDDLRDHLITTTPNLRVFTIGLYLAKLSDSLRDKEFPFLPDTGPPDEDDEGKRKRLLTNIPKALLPEVPKSAVSSLRELRVVLYPPDNYCIGDRSCIGLLGTYWKSYDVELYISSRTQATVVPPILYDEKDRAPVDYLLYSTQDGVSKAAEDGSRPDGPRLSLVDDILDIWSVSEFQPVDWGNGFENFDFMDLQSSEAFGFDDFDFDSFNADTLLL